MFLAESKLTTAVIAGFSGATIIGVAGVLAASHYKLSAIEFAPAVGVITRAIFKFVFLSMVKWEREKCLEAAFKTGLNQFDFSLFIMEVILFQISNINYFAGILLFFTQGPLIRRPKAFLELEDCEKGISFRIWRNAALILFLLPCFLA